MFMQNLKQLYLTELKDRLYLTLSLSNKLTKKISFYFHDKEPLFSFFFTEKTQPLKQNLLLTMIANFHNPRVYFLGSLKPSFLKLDNMWCKKMDLIKRKHAIACLLHLVPKGFL